MKKITLALLSIVFIGVLSCKSGQPKFKADDGHNLWFHSLAKYGELPPSEMTTKAILQNELDHFWKGDKRVIIDISDTKKENIGDEGYIIQFSEKEVKIESNTDIGALYGVYNLLRLQETSNIPDGNQVITEIPAYDYRLLNHWDNPNGTVERGYAGKSLWKWNDLPDIVSPVYQEYARANASIGINGTVINNVNADPIIITPEYLAKVKVLADIFRPYGLKVFLSINFASPKHLANLGTSDPLDKSVIKWWNDKVAEIYSYIPDFGGFLVKANSEGQSGPQDYGRTHVDGANMLADALEPFGGIVMWRAFVYDAQSDDRAMQASEEFVPFDGEFRDNVIIQIKNGPIDFQPREPFSPLFGQLEKTSVMAELQITQEYLGHSNHLVYLHTMWKECLDSDTYQKGEGSTVAAITEGRVHSRPISAIAGVTNIGDSVNWCGHHFAQSNWYAYGRMAWNSELSSDQIADEWIRQTFSSNEKFIVPVKNMMMISREVTVNYEMPLGLHHIFAGAGHYGPGPWETSSRPDWSPLYYHKASKDGVGFDRTLSGSGAVAQYHEPLASLYNDINTCPENLILWFHHVPWDYKMKNGNTLWDELCYTYQRGIDEAYSFIGVWESVKPYVDERRYNDVYVKIVRQAKDAMWWRDACMQYFQQFSGLPFPEFSGLPQYSLDELRRFRLRISNYETPALNALPEYELGK
ncbi:MAG TPA: alpha-glucuronidase [Bacteroidaceae bacterium]|nr:alpha-glucuronidase [Bacteroidaceae bacterium]